MPVDFMALVDDAMKSLWLSRLIFRLRSAFKATFAVVAE